LFTAIVVSRCGIVPPMIKKPRRCRRFQPTGTNHPASA
jgi:hypothetical protein